MLECLSLVFHVARHKFFSLRALGLLRCLLTICKASYRRWGPALPACPPPQKGYIFYEWTARSQRRHGPSSATGTRAPSAVPPRRGSNSAMGARASNAVPLNHDTRACTSRAPPGHASRSKKAAPTSRRAHTRAVSSPILRGREAAVGLRCGKATQVRRDCLRDSTRCLFAIVAGALSIPHQGGADNHSYLVSLIQES